MISKNCGQGKRPDLLLFRGVIIAAKLQILSQKINDTEAIGNVLIETFIIFLVQVIILTYEVEWRWSD